MAAQQDRPITVAASNNCAHGITMGGDGYGFMRNGLGIKKFSKSFCHTVNAGLIETVAIDIYQFAQ
jgi:hypothetical protein